MRKFLKFGVIFGILLCTIMPCAKVLARDNVEETPSLEQLQEWVNNAPLPDPLPPNRAEFIESSRPFTDWEFYAFDHVVYSRDDEVCNLLQIDSPEGADAVTFPDWLPLLNFDETDRLFPMYWARSPYEDEPYVFLGRVLSEQQSLILVTDDWQEIFNTSWSFNDHLIRYSTGNALDVRVERLTAWDSEEFIRRGFSLYVPRYPHGGELVTPIYINNHVYFLQRTMARYEREPLALQDINLERPSTSFDGVLIYLADKNLQQICYFRDNPLPTPHMDSTP